MSDKHLAEELFGRHLRPGERQTILHGFRLKFLRWEELPSDIQNQTDRRFCIYGLVPDTRKRSGVRILLLELSEKEREAVNELNFGDKLYDHLEVSVGGIMARVEVLKDRTRGINVENGLSYPSFLNGEQAAIITARQIRERILSSEGNLHGKER